jgi:CheY-like chemotaxis protein
MNAVFTAPVLAPAAPAVGEKSLRILVVDDEADIRDLQADILKRAGYRVDTAKDGTSAWRALHRIEYDLLVTDYLMPGTSGLALVRQLRVVNMALPIVMVSGQLEKVDIARVSHDPWSRVDAFVRKPFTVPEFLSAVNTALGRGIPAKESLVASPTGTISGGAEAKGAIGTDHIESQRIVTT